MSRLEEEPSKDVLTYRVARVMAFADLEAAGVVAWHYIKTYKSVSNIETLVLSAKKVIEDNCHKVVHISFEKLCSDISDGHPAITATYATSERTGATTVSFLCNVAGSDGDANNKTEVAIMSVEGNGLWDVEMGSFSRGGTCSNIYKYAKQISATVGRIFFDDRFRCDLDYSNYLDSSDCKEGS